jgi:hypothetical protein
MALWSSCVCINAILLRENDFCAGPPARILNHVMKFDLVCWGAEMKHHRFYQYRDFPSWSIRTIFAGIKMQIQLRISSSVPSKNPVRDSRNDGKLRSHACALKKKRVQSRHCCKCCVLPGRSQNIIPERTSYMMHHWSDRTLCVIRPSEVT